MLRLNTERCVMHAQNGDCFILFIAVLPMPSNIWNYWFCLRFWGRFLFPFDSEGVSSRCRVCEGCFGTNRHTSVF
jgi:hypothetical protein